MSEFQTTIQVNFDIRPGITKVVLHFPDGTEEILGVIEADDTGAVTLISEWRTISGARLTLDKKLVKKFVRADSDKPHRCPKCWATARGINGSRWGKAMWYRTYSCDRCKVRWWRMWHD